MLERRAFLAGMGLGASALAACGPGAVAEPPAPAAGAAIKSRIAALEKESGGRLGVFVLDLQSGVRVGHRADERFAMCSTFKILAAAFVLARVDQGEERLDRRVAVRTSDLVAYSPVTQSNAGREMSVAELCAAAVTRSDNAAANLLLRSFGGPEALTAFLRGLGDRVTRLDRMEPALNESAPGDPRDTTSPAAMAVTLGKLCFGAALSESSRRQALDWLIANETGDRRLRAGLPGDWPVGDKTGTGERGTSNDVAVAWPPQGGPLLISAYLTDTTASGEARDAILAAVGRAVAGAWPRSADV